VRNKQRKTKTMKKLLILAAILVAGVAANAASFKWSAANIYGADGTAKFSGTATLYAVINSVDTEVSTATVASGVIAQSATTFANDKLVANTYYDFYFVIEDGGKTFTSTTKNVLAQESATASIGFGNMQSATQNASNWVAVPEPTSGLLMLLGMAGLALRRRRA